MKNGRVNADASLTPETCCLFYYSSVVCPHCACVLLLFVASSIAIGLAVLGLGGLIWVIWLALASPWYWYFEWLLLVGGVLAVVLTSWLYYDARTMVVD
jgi:hypothetical protein